MSSAAAAAAGDVVRFDFRRDPSRQGFVVQGADDGRFDADGPSLAVHLDSAEPGARLLAPLPFTLDGGTSFVVEADLVLEDVDASPVDFFQVSFGLVNAATTGLNRTGTSLPVFPFFVDDSDVFDSVELAYFPNVTGFGGPFLQPTVFGAESGSAFANFAANFGPSSDLGDNTGEEILALPQDTPLRVVMRHDACRQQLVTTVLDLSGSQPVELATGLLPLDLAFLNATGTFEVDALAWNAYQDLADPDPSTTSLVAEISVLAARVERIGPLSARLVPARVQPGSGGRAHVRVDGWAGEPAGPVSARLVEVGGLPVDVAVEARAIGGRALLVDVPREAAAAGFLLDLDACLVALAAAPPPGP